MKYFIHILFLLLFLCLFSSGNLFAQEMPGVIKNTIEYRGNNSSDPNDVSGLPEVQKRTPEEINLINQIRQLRMQNDRGLLGRILELEDQLEALNTNSVSKAGEYCGGGVAAANNEINPFIPLEIGNKEIYNSGTKFISSIATATEQIGATAGRIWVAFSIRTTSQRDTIRVYYSDNNGVDWTWYAYAWLGGTDQINYDQMDMEIIENSTGEKYIWMVYGYRNDASSGRWHSGVFVLQTPTFAGNLYALSWPGDDNTKRYYRPRITSDNAIYPSVAYVYIVASFDSATTGGYNNTQKTLRCTNPYAVNPIFQYKADNFFWQTTQSDVLDLHSDIAYFSNGADSIIVSYSNVPTTTKLFFAKSDIFNGPATPNGAGGFIGGNRPDDVKDFARLSSNGNNNGSVFCVFRQNTNSVWWITYFRTINFGNFNNIDGQATLQGSVTGDSYQPDVVGVRNKPKHYFAWRHDGTPDSIRYIGTDDLGFWDQNVAKMNSQTSISGTIGVKPSFRYVDNDSCFVIYSLFGPYDLWAAYGCEEGTTASITVTAPNGGETWGVGTSQNITWTSTAVANVRIELSINNGASWSDVIASTPSTGIYNWTVPNSPSTQCLIRISEVGNPSVTDQSNGLFTIAILPGVEEELNGIPESYTLLQNYPNPFNPVTTIYYGLPEESSISLIVFDILGNEILKISEEQKPAGYHKFTFDASTLNSGIYFYKLEASNFVQTKKMILIK